MKNILVKSVAAIALLATNFSQALATPLVYSCTVTDYLDDKVLAADFQYIVGSGFLSFKTEYSEIRMDVVGEVPTLAMSLRTNSASTTYARNENDGLPTKVALIIATHGFASTVRCSL